MCTQISHCLPFRQRIGGRPELVTMAIDAVHCAVTRTRHRFWLGHKCASLASHFTVEQASMGANHSPKPSPPQPNTAKLCIGSVCEVTFQLPVSSFASRRTFLPSEKIATKTSVQNRHRLQPRGHYANCRGRVR